MNSATEHAELDYWRRLIPPVRSRSACEQLFQLRELFGQAFRRSGGVRICEGRVLKWTAQN